MTCECGRAHDNPRCICTTDDWERAAMFSRAVDALCSADGVAPDNLRFMPLKQGKKEPAIMGRYRLESREADLLLHSVDEAYHAIVNGHRGFGLYFGREDHGTEGVLGVDNDDPDTFPMDEFPATGFVVTSGSGTTEGHLYYTHDGDVNNAADTELGEVRVENLYCAFPGSVHDTGGIYHLHEDGPPGHIRQDDIPERLRPSRPARNRGDSDPIELTPPDDLADAFFTNDDGVPLKTLRKKSPYLDKLLRRLDHPDWDNDTSKGDYRCAYQLAFWGFDTTTATDIIRRERARQKIRDRPRDYLQRTVENAYADQNETYDPPERETGNHDCNYDPGYVADLPATSDTRAATTDWTTDNRHHDLTKADVHRKVEHEIDAAQAGEECALIDGIMSVGKTYSALKVAADEGRATTYFAPRRDTMAQAKEWADELGLKAIVLPSAPHDCPTFAGEHGDAWRDRVWAAYTLGAKPSTLHDQWDLPCHAGEGHCCPYLALHGLDWSQFDLIIGHYNHAHLPTVTKGRHVVIDEYDRDSMWTTIEGDALAQHVTAFCKRFDDFPYDHYDELVADIGEDTDRTAAAYEWFEATPPGVDEPAALRQDYHACTPEAVYVMLDGDRVGRDGYPFIRSHLPGDESLRGVWFRGDEYDPKRVALQTPPDLDYARSVVCLDGTPEPDAWELLLNRAVTHRRVLTDEERRTFLRDVQNVVGVQVSEHAKPYSSGDYVTSPTDAAKIEAAAIEYGHDPVVFAPKKAKKRYFREGVPEMTRVKAFDHFGNLRGTNRYADEQLAFIAGSSHWGDTWVKMLAAMDGIPVYPEGKGVDRDYGTGEKYARLMREAEVGQAAMRVGRHDEGAVVVFNTALVPEWFPVVGTGSVTRTWTPTQREIACAVQQLARGDDPVTVSAIHAHDLVDCSRRHIYTVLEKFAEFGYVEIEHDGQRLVYLDDGLHRLSEHDQAELPAVDLAALADSEAGDGDEVAHRTIIMPEFNPLPPQNVATTEEGRNMLVLKEDAGGERLHARPPPG